MWRLSQGALRHDRKASRDAITTREEFFSGGKEHPVSRKTHGQGGNNC